MKRWIVVHDEESFIENSRALGFAKNIHHVNELSVGDAIIYYQNGGYIKGIYKITKRVTFPTKIEPNWDSDFQFALEPILELHDKTDIRPHVDNLAFISNKAKWGLSLFGVNAIRRLEVSDYNYILELLLEELSQQIGILASNKHNKVLEEKISDSSNQSDIELANRLAEASKTPTKSAVISNVYDRNPDVIAFVLRRANGICEECGNPAPFLRKSNNTPYLEVHHLVRLSDGGEDSVNNAKAVCPNCHRKLHFGY